MSQWKRWIDQHLSAPGEGEQALKTIQLTAEGTVWETWTAPFADVATFTLEAEQVMAAFAEESPKRRIPLMFTALDTQGAIKTQCPAAVQGKNAQADAIAGSGNNAAKAFADAMTALTNLNVAVLKSAQTQVESLTRTITSQAEQIADFIEYHKAKQEAEIIEREHTNTVNTFVQKQLEEAMPLLLAVGEHFVTNLKNPASAAPLADVAKKVINGANPS